MYISAINRLFIPRGMLNDATHARYTWLAARTARNVPGVRSRLYGNHGKQQYRCSSVPHAQAAPRRHGRRRTGKTRNSSSRKGINFHAGGCTFSFQPSSYRAFSSTYCAGARER